MMELTEDIYNTIESIKNLEKPDQVFSVIMGISQASSMQDLSKAIGLINVCFAAISLKANGVDNITHELLLKELKEALEYFYRNAVKNPQILELTELVTSSMTFRSDENQTTH